MTVSLNDGSFFISTVKRISPPWSLVTLVINLYSLPKLTFNFILISALLRPGAIGRGERPNSTMILVAFVIDPT